MRMPFISPAAFSIIRNGLEYAQTHDFFVRRSLYILQYAQMLDYAGQRTEAIAQARQALAYARLYHERHVAHAAQQMLHACGCDTIPSQEADLPEWAA